MGFRNPVTTIGALDTGQGFAVGSVQSYTDNPTGALGSALHTAAGFQFRDGISGDTPAAVVNVANYVAQGAGALTGQGGGLTVAAGSYNGVQGPRIDLNVENAPAGGYAVRARVSAPWQPIGVDVPVVGPGPNPAGGSVLGPGFVQFGTPFERVRIVLRADGSVQITGLLKNAFGAALPDGSVVVKTLPAWAVPAASVITPARCAITSGTAPGVTRVDVQSNGLLVLKDAPLGNGDWLALACRYDPTNT